MTGTIKTKGKTKNIHPHGNDEHAKQTFVGASITKAIEQLRRKLNIQRNAFSLPIAKAGDKKDCAAVNNGAGDVGPLESDEFVQEASHDGAKDLGSFHSHGIKRQRRTHSLGSRNLT
jgi:hypothetical protein